MKPKQNAALLLKPINLQRLQLGAADQLSGEKCGMSAIELNLQVDKMAEKKVIYTGR